MKPIHNGLSKYGRLYDWKTAKTVCPSGWHLPSNAEWSTLIRYVDNDKGCFLSCAGEHLKANSPLWNNTPFSNSNGKGTDYYGFSALPGGSGHSNGSFDQAGDYGYWWTATESTAIDFYAYYMSMSSYTDVDGFSGDKSGLLSVRCLQD